MDVGTNTSKPQQAVSRLAMTQSSDGVEESTGGRAADDWPSAEFMRMTRGCELLRCLCINFCAVHVIKKYEIVIRNRKTWGGIECTRKETGTTIFLIEGPLSICAFL